MNRSSLLLTAVTIAGLFAVGCVDLLAGSDDPDRLAGTWQVRALMVDHGCSELGPLTPVDPGALTFERDGNGWRVSPLNSGDPVVYDEIGYRTWQRVVSGEVDGCFIDASARWTFRDVGQARFTSIHHTVIEAEGDCGVEIETCEVSYTVTGVRR